MDLDREVPLGAVTLVVIGGILGLLVVTALVTGDSMLLLVTLAIGQAASMLATFMIVKHIVREERLRTMEIAGLLAQKVREQDDTTVTRLR